MVLCLFGFFQAALILSLYQFWIVSSLVRYVPTNTFRSAEDIFSFIERGKFTLVLPYLGHWFYEEVRNSDYYSYKMLRQSTLTWPTEFMPNVSKLLRLVDSGKYVSITQDDGPVRYSSSNFCNMMSVTEGMPQKEAHIIFKKGNLWKEHFSSAILHERYYIKRVRERYQQNERSKRKRLCADYYITQKKFRPLSIVPFLGLIFVCAIGIFLAIVICFIEKKYFTNFDRPLV